MTAHSLLLACLATTATGSDFDQDVRVYLEAHCIECHSGERPQGDLDLEPALEERGARRAEPIDWAYLRERVDWGEMPPRGRARPRSEDTDRLLAWLDAAHELTPPEHRPLDPGRPVLRRLNHREYRNTVRDLLGVDVPVEELFPAEAVGHGFDHIGESLTLPDALFEKYLESAERVAAEAWIAFGPEDLVTRRYQADELDGPERGGFIAMTTNGVADARHVFPLGGRYRLRVGAFGQQAGPDLCKMAVAVDGLAGEVFEVPNRPGDVGLFEAEVELEAGAHRIGAAFLNDYYKPDDPRPRQRDRNLFIEYVEVHGPLDPPPPSELQTGLLESFPESLGKQRFRKLLSHFADQLWRRPATSPELHRVERSLDASASFDRRVQDALVLLLVSPDFLFRFERDHDDPRLVQLAEDLAGERELLPGVVALDGHELATRLSFFLWSTAPDAELKELALSGALLEDEVLEAQASRMLTDPRAWAFTESFAGQWLQLRRLEQEPPGTRTQAGFDEQLAASMVRETLLVFDALLHEDHDLRRLLDADFTFLDGRLAEHYGLELEATPQEPWRRVALEGERRGVVGHASILTLTSEPTRTSPVKRGKWLLETLLNAPPPPPPVDAGSFDNDGVGASAASLREELAQHRARAECAPCHDAMDPLGLALENFGPTGSWREDDQGVAIDATGEFPDGRVIDGPGDLLEVLRDDPAFVRAVVERLYVYALGRPIERGDRALVNEILEGLDQDHPTLREAIQRIVASPAFRLRRGGV